MKHIIVIEIIGYGVDVVKEIEHRIRQDYGRMARISINPPDPPFATTCKHCGRSSQADECLDCWREHRRTHEQTPGVKTS